MEARAANGFFLDDDQLVNKSTGEVIDPIILAVPPGTCISTPDERVQRFEAMEERLTREKFRHRDGETYFFIRRDVCFDNVPPAMVTKLLYLGTFVRFDDNVLMLTQRTRLQRKDLADVLRVSTGGASNFWNAVYPSFLMQDNEGNLRLNETLFRRGRLHRNNYIPYFQLFDAGIRSLYMAAGGKHHKRLGYLFKLLPYISMEYNLVCYNPEVENMEEIQLMSISDFCAAIGYSRGNIDKLVRFYNDFRFDVDDRQERFCTIMYHATDTCNAVICINPAIMFSGSNQSRVEITQRFFSD